MWVVKRTTFPSLEIETSQIFDTIEEVSTSVKDALTSGEDVRHLLEDEAKIEKVYKIEIVELDPETCVELYNKQDTKEHLRYKISSLKRDLASTQVEHENCLVRSNFLESEILEIGAELKELEEKLSDV